MATAVASRYARALADLVFRPNSGVEPDAAVGQLREFEQALAASPELRQVMLSPAVPPSRKRAVIGRLTSQAGISPLVRNFLYVLVDHRRAAILRDVREAFETAIDQRRGVVRAEVASALPLSEVERQSIENGLARLSGKRVRPVFATDETLLGGVRARIGSTVYDGSVRGQLEELRRRLVSE